MSLATAEIDCTVSPPLSGAMEDCSIVQGPQLQRLCRQYIINRCIETHTDGWHKSIMLPSLSNRGRGKKRVATLQSLSNSLTVPNISSEYLRSIDPRNSSDKNEMHVISHCNTLQYTVTSRTTVFFSRLQWNNSLFLPSAESPPLEAGTLKSSYGVWGSAVGFPSGVWGGAPAQIEFGAF